MSYKRHTFVRTLVSVSRITLLQLFTSLTDIREYLGQSALMYSQRHQPTFAAILVCTAIFGSAKQTNMDFKSPCGKDVAFKGEPLGNPASVSSAIECGMRCSSDSRCHSFTFNKYSRKCQLSSGLAAATCENAVAEEGSTYMKAVSF